MKTILITGANRGLGLEFTRQYLDSGNRVIATCRNPSQAETLQGLKSSGGERLSIHTLDVSNEESIAQTADEVARCFDAIDILINNAGFGNWAGIDDTTLDNMVESYRINAAGPLIVARSFLPLLNKGERPLAVFITSKLGSITCREEMGKDADSYCYNTSKTALNMIGEMLTVQLKEDNIIVLLQSPGWARTDMGGQEATNSPQEVVAGMIKTFHRATLKDTGKFHEWTGQELPW